MKLETPNSKYRLLTASKLKFRLFRNNRGFFWTLDKKRKVKAGLLAEHSGDYIGWRTIEITPDMVGKRVAVYCEVEMKREGWVKPKTKHEEDQKERLDKVKKFGGIAGFCSTDEDLKKMLDDFYES